MTVTSIETKEERYKRKQREWREAHPDYQKKWRTENKDRKPKTKNALQDRERFAEWRRLNPDYAKNYYQKNKKRIINKVASWKSCNKSKVKAYTRTCALNRRDKIKIENRNPKRRLISSLRKRMKQFMFQRMSRSDGFACSPIELRAHIERQFKVGMTWGNYGKWHVDHIVPCSAFDLTNPEHIKTCFHFNNLRPLWAKDNMEKGAKNIFPQLKLRL